MISASELGIKVSEFDIRKASRGALCALGLAAFGLSGCGPLEPRYNCDPYQVDAIAPGPDLVEYFQDKNKDPIFRAGSVTIFNETGHGSGSILWHDGKYFLYSIKHVPQNLTAESCQLYAHIPSVGSYQINPGKFSYNLLRRTLDDDQAALYPLEGSISDDVQDAVESGRILPLKFSPLPLTAGETVVALRANTGLAIPLEVLHPAQYDDPSDMRRGYFQTRSMGFDHICRGRSGGPILKLDAQGNLTRNIVGVVSQGAGDYPDRLDPVSGQPICFNTALIRANFSNN